MVIIIQVNSLRPCGISRVVISHPQSHPKNPHYEQFRAQQMLGNCHQKVLKWQLLQQLYIDEDESEDLIIIFPCTLVREMQKIASLTKHCIVGMTS